MNRRKFLLNTTKIAAAPFFLNGIWYNTSAQPFFRDEFNADDRVLVLINLIGGNDGLNTLIPLDSLSNLSKHRSNIFVPENKITPFKGNLGLHPSAKNHSSLWENNLMGVIQDVGYPNPDLSHFRSTDIITSASDSDIIINTGWLGRFLTEDHAEFPKGYPNTNYPDPLALTIGAIASPTCQGLVNNMGIAVNDPTQTFDKISDQFENFENEILKKEVNYIRTVQSQTEVYLKKISEIVNKQTSLSTLYPNTRKENPLADDLRTVAKLLNGGLQTKIFVVSIGGFDTHANQIDSNDDGIIGDHNILLKQVFQAVEAFYDDLEKMKLIDRVLTMTFTEFGRRIKSNQSYGTDHGEASPTFLFGSEINTSPHGTPFIVPNEVNSFANVPMQFDFRSVYASVLKSWLGVPESTITKVLGRSFDFIPILKQEGGNVSEEEQEKEILTLDENILKQELVVFPNPVSKGQSLKVKVQRNLFDSNTLKNNSQALVFKLYNTQGRLIQSWTISPKQEEILELKTTKPSKGVYFLHILGLKSSEKHKIIFK